MDGWMSHGTPRALRRRLTVGLGQLRHHLRTRAFWPASWASLSYQHGDLLDRSSVRRDQTGRTTSDPVSPCSLAAHQPRRLPPAFHACTSATFRPVNRQKICKYIGTFFSWDTDQSRGVKMVDLLRTAFTTGAGPAKRIPFVRLAPCSLIPWLPLARRRIKPRKCAVEQWYRAQSWKIRFRCNHWTGWHFFKSLRNPQ